MDSVKLQAQGILLDTHAAYKTFTPTILAIAAGKHFYPPVEMITRSASL